VGVGSQLLLRKISRSRNCNGKSLRLSSILDSAGVYLPLQDEIFPDKEHFGRILNNAQMSRTYPPAIMGSCVAGGAIYLL
jgi:acetyl-CoA carboxylase carboxyltransferase component